ncbi:hypothetical protein DFH11DRAFT_855007 [Phellopilus nigrolimitatus]|nr:hypothetical protein DFH11DRAFT_855007 [Phellopilus nigrolimitatus]
MIYSSISCLQSTINGVKVCIDPVTAVGLRDYTTFPFHMLVYTGACIVFCAMVLLQLRTYALFGKNRNILYAFCILNILAVVFFIYEATELSRLQYITRYVRPSTLGLDLGGTTSFYTPLFWAPYFINETTSFSLVLYKAWRTNTFRCIIRQRSLADMIVQDNVLYFSVIFVAYLLGLCLLSKEDLLFFAHEHLLGSIAISGILAPNLFISLKKSYYMPIERIYSSPTAISDFQALPGAQEVITDNTRIYEEQPSPHAHSNVHEISTSFDV